MMHVLIFVILYNNKEFFIKDTFQNSKNNKVYNPRENYPYYNAI